jgi:hypothetical protein
LHFYVDESGHTGPNLFDPEQPMLYYGVLSSKVNVDVLAEERLERLRTRLGVSRLHAAELGNGGLVQVVDDLCEVQSRLNLRFDIYRVAKPDHAIISFFDQVFDQGMNPAVTWTGYWTPLRYILLGKLASLFDERLAELAWQARLELNDAKSEAVLVQVCQELLERVPSLPDARSIEVISDALTWAAKNPAEISYNASTKKDRLSIMPNIIGFQSVMLGIAARLNKTELKASRIIVDQQSQFNKAQRTLAEFYAAARSIQFASGPGLPELSFKGMPTTPIEFSSSGKSAGLELTDVYLWVFRRAMENSELAPKLYSLIKPQLRRGRTDEISLNALIQRWGEYFENIPEPTAAKLEEGRALLAFDEARRRKAIGKDA